MLLLKGENGQKTKTCLVDLDFQHGSCCDYLDLEPRLDLDEIEPRPERLDRQLLEVMLSEHPSGLKVIAAPSRPAEMRSFDFEVVTRLLDLVAAHFDNVVIDVPRTWFAWTDSVLIGSNRLFLVTEMTVPGLKHARHLVNVIRERLPDGPQLEVIVNRFEQRLFGPGLRRADIEQALGDSLAATIPNNFRLVSEAIDRGVPLDEVKAGNNIAHVAEQADLPAEERQGRESRSLPASASSRWHAEGTHVRPLHRIETHRRGRSRRARRPRSRLRRSAAGRGAEPAGRRRSCRSSSRTRSPRLRSRRCATSCSTPRCGCIAG